MSLSGGVPRLRSCHQPKTRRRQSTSEPARRTELPHNKSTEGPQLCRQPQWPSNTVGHQRLPWFVQIVSLNTHNARLVAFPSDGALRATRPAAQTKCRCRSVTGPGVKPLAVNLRKEHPYGSDRATLSSTERPDDMKRPTDRPAPPRLKRCSVCGHPNQEHRGPLGCTVPQCECDDFTELEIAPAKD